MVLQCLNANQPHGMDQGPHRETIANRREWSLAPMCLILGTQVAQYKSIFMPGSECRLLVLQLLASESPTHTPAPLPLPWGLRQVLFLDLLVAAPKKQCLPRLLTIAADCSRGARSLACLTFGGNTPWTASTSSWDHPFLVYCRGRWVSGRQGGGGGGEWIGST